MKELERESGEKTGDALKDVLDRYGRVETRYAHLDGYHYENNIKRVLMGLGYPESTWEHNALAFRADRKRAFSWRRLLSIRRICSSSTNRRTTWILS